MQKRTNLPIGTFINMLTVLIGGTIGLVLQQSFPENIKEITFEAIGLGTILLGILMSIKLPSDYILVMIFSLIVGGVTGELIQLDQQLIQAGDFAKRIFNISSGNFTEGLLTAFIIFCIGSMTLVGAIEEGVQGNRDLLMVKSLLDGVTSIALASTYGVGVLFSIFPMLVLQGGTTLLASQAEKFFQKEVIDVLSAVGGLLILAIGFRLLGVDIANIENLLPALVYAVLGVWGMKWMNQSWEKPKKN